MTEETQWTTDGLPEELHHDKIAYYRDVGSNDSEGFQIGFSQTWLPYGYYFHIPDRWEMKFARLEHHRPYKKGWKRFLPCWKEYLVVVIRNSRKQQ